MFTPGSYLLNTQPMILDQLLNAACKGIIYLSATNLARSGWELPVRSLIEFVAIIDDLYLLSQHESEAIQGNNFVNMQKGSCPNNSRLFARSDGPGRCFYSFYRIRLAFTM